MSDHCQTYVTSEHLLFFVGVIIVINIMTTAWFFSAWKTLRKNDAVLEQININRDFFEIILKEVRKRQIEIANMLTSPLKK